jgi:DNA invertase Pin-like site-specific DNA recombinase
VKAFGYVRLSKEDAASTSPARQRQRIASLCRDRRWTLVEVFEDIDVSAFNGKRRPGFEGMMGRLAEVDAIVFWRLDRLSRSVAHFSKVLEETQAADVQLVSTDQPIDTASAMGKAFVQISSVFAELEAGTTSERSRQMMAYKHEMGEWVGRVPFGWRRKAKGIEPDPKQQAILRKAARRYVAGETFSAVARDLGFQVGPLSRMLGSQRVQDALPARLSADLVAATLARRTTRAPTSKMSLLGGIARCGECGATMTASSTRADRPGRWFSYGCLTAGHVHISATFLDDHVAGKVVAAIDRGKVLAALRAGRKLGRTRRATEIEARMELLEEAHFVEGKIPAERYKRLHDALVEQLAAARSREQAASTLPEELLRDLPDRWPDLTVPERRAIIMALVDRIEIAKGKGNGPVDPRRVRILWRTP